MKRVFLTLLLVGSVACAGHRAPLLVADASNATADTIQQLSTAGAQLVDAKVLPPNVALSFQGKLKAVNDQLRPLPDILRTIDRLQVAGDPTASETDRAIAILTVVGQDISVVVAGVPLSETTSKLIDLIRASQKTVQTTLIEVAKLKGREE